VNRDGIALDHGIEHSKSCTNTRPSRSSREFLNPAFLSAWRPCHTDSRRDSLLAGNQCPGNSFVRWIDFADWRVREYLRLLSLHQSWNLVIFFIPVPHHVHPDSVVQSYTLFHMPAILDKSSGVLVSPIIGA